MPRSATQGDAGGVEQEAFGAPQPVEADPTTKIATNLPAEGELPSVKQNEPDRPQPVEGPGLPLANSPDGVPWLRFNLPGHTAPLRTLCFTADGNRLCSAGDDKAVVVWRGRPKPGPQVRAWDYERTIRWQVQRATRGRIYALEAASKYLALAGEGAMGGAGEILLVNPQTGELIDVLNDLDEGHRQVVVALSAAPDADGATLASMSMDGCLVHWSQTDNGLWRAVRVRGADAERHPNDSELRRRLLASRAFSAVAAVSARRIVAPVFVEARDGRTVWRLERFDAAAGRSDRLANDDESGLHWDYVTAMAVGDDGRRLASADGGGNVFLWDLTSSPPRLRKLPRLSAPATSLSFDRSGERLALSTSARTSGGATVEVWNVADLANPQRIAGFKASKSVLACSLSPDGQSIAWTSGSSVRIRPVSSGSVRSLSPVSSPPTRVAFPLEKPYHRIGFAKTAAADASRRITHRFDTTALRLDLLNPNAQRRGNRPVATAWLPEDWLSQGWSIRQDRQSDGRVTIWMYQGESRRARVELREETHGAYRSVCWIPSRQAGQGPVAAAVGSSAGGIYLFKTARAGDAPMLRQFRGHTAEITSLAVSRDLRYLASASRDGTVRFWPLRNVVDETSLVQRWGGDFRVQNGELVAASIRPEGPVYFRGIRNDDRVTEIRYVEGQNVRIARDATEIRKALEEMSWDALTAFTFVRGRDAPRQFQILPAWQQLATLFAAEDGQWAYWTPAGYYDASFEGHRLFGWQINRGLALLPDFFLAAQFRRQLERPRVMSRLLSSGNLEGAFRAAQLEPPANSPQAIANAYRLKPSVEIVAPRSGEKVSQGAKLRARIELDSASQLVPPKAFANGVIAVNRRLVSEQSQGSQRSYVYEW
ncbi:MAG: hypothetical protein AAF961_03375, partial [Planctomycetota bacterium]